MLRFRALLGLALAATWMSAAWHVDLEAVGWMFDHQHHHAAAEHSHHDADGPTGLGEQHDPIFAREATKDGSLRLAAVEAGNERLPPGDVAPTAGGAPRRGLDREPIPIREHEVRSRQKPWQFMWRCAPEAVAPPALG